MSLVRSWAPHQWGGLRLAPLSMENFGESQVKNASGKRGRDKIHEICNDLTYLHVAELLYFSSAHEVSVAITLT